MEKISIKSHVKNIEYYLISKKFWKLSGDYTILINCYRWNYVIMWKYVT